MAAAGSGWEVGIAAPDTEQTRPLLDELQATGVAHIAVSTGSARRLIRGLGVIQFLGELVWNRPSVVLMSMPWPTSAFGQLLMCAAVDVPTVVVFQLVPEEDQPGTGSISRRLPLYRWIRRRRQTWVAVSQFAGRGVARLFNAPASSILCIYNGVDVDGRNGTSAGNAAAARRAVGLEADQRLVLSVGRLAAQKGHTDLLSAFALIAPRHPQVRLLIAGDGPERSRLETMIRSLGLDAQVRLLGHADDVWRLHRAAELFVLPSLYEGTPFAMLEAMASGLPVIATTFGGADEIVEHGRDGLLVPTGDVEVLAQAIERALGDRSLRETLGAAARQRVRDFSKERMLDEVLAVLERAASAA
jgi:glycosyltransferase involved in cell wall biosynthesis